MRKIICLIFLLFSISIPLISQELHQYDYIVCNRNSDNYNFYLACINNDVNYIKEKLEFNISPNCELTADEDKKIAKIILEKSSIFVYNKTSFVENWHGTPIIVATYMNNSAIIDLLVQKGADINVVSNYGTDKNLLEITIDSDNFELFEYYVNLGLDPFKRTNNYYSLFTMALFSENDDKRFVDFFFNNKDKLLLSAEVIEEITKLVDEMGYDPLFLSLFKTFPVIRDSCIKKFYSKQENVLRLFEYSIDPDSTEEEKELFNYLIKNRPSYFYFSQDFLNEMFFYTDDYTIIKHLIQYFPDVKESVINSPIMYSFLHYSGDDLIEQFSYFYKLGCSLELEYEDYELIPIEIVKNGDLDLYNYLKEQHYNFNKFDNIIFYALDGDEITIVKDLLKTEDFNKTYNGLSLYHYSASTSSLDIFEYIFSKCKNINETSSENKSALIYAIENKSIEIIEFLLNQNIAYEPNRILDSFLENKVGQYSYFSNNDKAKKILLKILERTDIITSDNFDKLIRYDYDNNTVEKFLEKLPNFSNHNIYLLYWNDKKEFIYSNYDKVKINYEFNFKDAIQGLYEKGMVFRIPLYLAWNFRKSNSEYYKYYWAPAVIFDESFQNYSKKIQINTDEYPDYYENDVIYADYIFCGLGDNSDTPIMILIPQADEQKIANVFISRDFYHKNKLSTSEKKIFDNFIENLESNMWIKLDNIYLYKKDSKIVYFIEQYSNVYLFDLSSFEITNLYSLKKDNLLISNNYINYFGNIDKVDIH